MLSHWKFNLFILLISILQSACIATQFSNPKKGELFYNPESTKGTVQFINFMKVMKSRCLSCHSTDINGNYALLQTEDQWLSSGLVAAGDIYSSPLYLALKGPNPNGKMPKNLDPIPTSEINTIKSWIEVAHSSSTGFSGMAVRLGNRNYVNSVFNHVFGKLNTQSQIGSTKFNTLSEKKILYNLSSFQGTCDIYSVRANGAIDLTVQMPQDLNDDWCPSENNLDKTMVNKMSNPVIGKTNSVRMGYLTQVCEGQTNHLPSLEYAMKTHLGWVSGDLAVNDTNLQKAYESFYAEKTIPTAFKNSLIDVANTTTVNKDKWKWIFLTVCLSAEWQVP